MPKLSHVECDAVRSIVELDLDGIGPSLRIGHTPARSFGNINRPYAASCSEFRCILEGKSAALAAQCRDARLRAAITTRRKAMDAAALRGEPGIEKDIAFHSAIAKASENRYLILTISALMKQTRTAIRVVRELSPQPLMHRWRDVRAEHMRIDEAIAARDHAAARKAMTQHLCSGIARLFPRKG